MTTTPLLQTTIDDWPKRQGKVRDIYDLGDALLIVATDRISAFDVVMPNGIPDKGKVLTQISAFWFKWLEKQMGIRHHVIEVVGATPKDTRLIPYIDQLCGRAMLVVKTDVLPVECVVRGYLAGSGWKDYQKTNAVCGITLPANLVQCEELPEPIFTPATKATTGHDENISIEQAAKVVGADTINYVKAKSIEVYKEGREYARTRGIILADTKFEWGRDPKSGELILIDEVLTPDSSRFWPADEYETGRDQVSFDKQYVRNYLSGLDWDKTPPGPELPDDVVQGTRQRYLEAYEKLTGHACPFCQG